MNAILSANEPVRGYTLYTWPPADSPTCDRCAAHVIQAGIIKVVGFTQETEFSERWKEANKRAIDIYNEAGVKVQLYPLEEDDGK